ncbi:MAG: hypothetical protein ABJG47_00860 [Ekhidna sp.]
MFTRQFVRDKKETSNRSVANSQNTFKKLAIQKSIFQRVANMSPQAAQLAHHQKTVDTSVHKSRPDHASYLHATSNSESIQLAAIQFVGARSIGDRHDDREEYRQMYNWSWIEELINMGLLGNYRDLYRLYFELQDTEAQFHQKVEAIIRYLQHHPEIFIIAAYVGILPAGITSWVPAKLQPFLSRGVLSDAIGGHIAGLFSKLQHLLGPVGFGYVSRMLGRLVGRSIINRGLLLMESIGGGLVSGLSRWFHGYEIVHGAHPAVGDHVGRAGERFDNDSRSPAWGQDRAHLHSAAAAGKREYRADNIVMTSASTNSLMKAHEDNNAEDWVAIRTPSGWGEAVGTDRGATMIRAQRPAPGRTEVEMAKKGYA